MKVYILDWVYDTSCRNYKSFSDDYVWKYTHILPERGITFRLAL